MELIPTNQSIPPLYATENESNPLCQIKLFTPDANWTWYIIEMDETQELCFGYVVGLDKELGYFSLSEISAIRGTINLPVERDLGFKPMRFNDLKRLHEN